MDLRPIASDSLLFDFQFRDENWRLSAIALSAGSLGDTRTVESSLSLIGDDDGWPS
jgi:hypothetical protein